MLLILAACGSDGGGGPAPEPDAAAIQDAGPTVDAFDSTGRPYELVVPSGYVAGTPAPLVVLLHGYGADAARQEMYFRFGPVAEAEGALYAKPQGTIDGLGNRFWAATDACCGTGVDDVRYLRAVLDDIAARYTVDARRIYLLGHSNGGFMAHRLACELSDRIAAIVSLAGAVWNDPAACPATSGVAVAQVHGTLDTIVQYGGGIGNSGGMYPSAPTTLATWQGKNGCTGDQPGAALDLVTNLAGAETSVTRSIGCRPGGAAELWTITGGAHVPLLRAAWAAEVWSFFAAHPKP